MADQPHKYQFKVLDDKEIKVLLSEHGNARSQTNAWDPERPLYCAALNGLLTLLEFSLENSGKIPIPAVQQAVSELYKHDYRAPSVEPNPVAKDYTRLFCELTVKGDGAQVQEALWYLLTSLPGIRRVDFTGEETCDDADLEVEDDYEEEDLPGADPDDGQAHRHILGFCAVCDGSCNYDEFGRYVGAENYAFFE